MNLYKPVVVFIFFTCFFYCHFSSAQAPVILPKAQPIVLPLDSTGYYKINPDDLATYINNSDSVLHFKLSPKNFDCSKLGKQTVTITASTNGAKGERESGKASFYHAIGLCTDNKGNMYVAENQSFVIRKITPLGEVSTYAGNGKKGYVDGPAGVAEFAEVLGIAADSAGNVYVSDASNRRIRKISTNGVVSTYAGSGNASSLDGTAMEASFDVPFCLATDGKQNVYVTERGSNRIRKITPGGQVTTIAGSYNAGYNDGPVATATFNQLWGLTTDVAGNVYVCDYGNHAIRKIDQQGMVSTYVGGKGRGSMDGNRSTAFIYGPMCVKIDQTGTMYVGDFMLLRKITSDGQVTTLAGTEDTGYVDAKGADARFIDIVDLTFDPCGNILVTDYDNDRIRKIKLDGTVSTYAGGNGGLQVINGNVGPSTCQITTAVIPVKVQSHPIITSAHPDVNLYDCSILPDYTAKAAATDNCPPGVIKFTQSPLPYTLLQNNAPTDVTVTATDSTGGTASVTFKVTAHYGATVTGNSSVITPAATEICAGMPDTFVANLTHADPGTSYQWLINGSATGANSATFTTNLLKDGDVVNCAITSASGCAVPNLGTGIKVKVDALPIINLKKTEQLVAGNSIQLNPVVIGNIATYMWTPAAGLSSSILASPIANPSVTTTYLLKVISSDGCEVTDSVTVTVVNNIIVPNTFTPNSDGINDQWNIRYLSDYANSTVDIYNRYGAQVFHSNGYPHPWTGILNGKELPVGVYYYIISLKKNRELLRGSVTIIR